MRRKGFALIELVVVAAVIGLLVALLMAGVQAARESGRRIQCQSNLKQFGIALQGYADVFGVFPPRSTSRGFSFHVAILPQLEQAPLYNQIDFSARWAAPQNAWLRQTYIAVFHCPNDGLRKPFATNYAGNYGSGVQKFGYQNEHFAPTATIDCWGGAVLSGIDATIKLVMVDEIEEEEIVEDSAHIISGAPMQNSSWTQNLPKPNRTMAERFASSPKRS